VSRYLTLALVVLALALPAFSSPAKRSRLELERQQYDLKISGDLQKINAGALPIFEQANREREAEDHKKAAAHYEEVTLLAPTFDAAWRRAAWERQELNEHDAAIRLQRHALELNASPENFSTLSMLLVARQGEISDADRSEGVAAARRAMQMAPADLTVQAAVSTVALSAADQDLLQQSSDSMMHIAPDEWMSHYFHSFALAMKGDLSTAGDELETAHRLGLPDEQYEEVKAAFAGARPLWQRLLIWSAWLFLPWALGLGILYLAGSWLSRIALRAIGELPANGDGNATPLGSNLRRTYAAVIATASAYYYISSPITILLTLAVLGGALVAVMAAGWLPVKLIVIAVLVGGVSVFSLLRSLFSRSANGDPGPRLDLDANPKMKACLSEVAERIGTHPVDTVFVTPGTDVAVFERGSAMRGNHRERCLILGAGTLDGFALRDFKAVLGHEYGHFVNRDTANGRLALSVRNSIARAAMHVAQGGAATWYNPAWHFLRGYYSIFLRISQGASRFQEAMADRWAAFAYGSAAFGNGLRHVISREVAFDSHTSMTLKEVIEEKRSLTNLYAYSPQTTEDPSQMEARVKEVLERETSLYDSHPAFAERIRWVEAISTMGNAPAETEESDAWSLFADRAAIEREMTDIIRRNVEANHGVSILATEEATA
jgi:Zn-dependent protease with chaperone function/tetratricopeptide (TPR) repeat protein